MTTPSRYRDAWSVANDAAEAIRKLNHLTLVPGDQLYELLGPLTIAVQRLDQTFGQLARWADDPKLTTHLHRAAAHVRDAAADLNLAWSALGTLPTPEPGQDLSFGGPEIGGGL